MALDHFGNIAVESRIPTPCNQSELIEALARIQELENELRVSAELNTLLALKLGLPGEALDEMIEMLRLPLGDRIQRIMAKAG